MVPVSFTHNLMLSHTIKWYLICMAHIHVVSSKCLIWHNTIVMLTQNIHAFKVMYNYIIIITHTPCARSSCKKWFWENCTIAFQWNGWWNSRISVWIWRCLGFSLTYVMLQNRILVWIWRCLGFSLTYVMLQNRILVWNCRGLGFSLTYMMLLQDFNLFKARTFLQRFRKG